MGLLFGLGFDTATEIALLVLAGTGAAAGVPWYAVMVLPLLFAAGMMAMDLADGLLMTAAYGRAADRPLRALRYNVVVTALSVAVALGVGTIQLSTVLHEGVGLRWRPVDSLAGLELGYLGVALVAVFATLLACAVWRRRGDRSGGRARLSAPRRPAPSS